MSRTLGHPSSQILCFFFVLFLHFFAVLSGESSSSMVEAKPGSHDASDSGRGFKALLICFGAVALVALCVFLYKKWQKKKREEQHARLLRLFEEDDDLELELGLRE